MTQEVADETIDDQPLGDRMLAEATAGLRGKMDLRWHVIAAAALLPSLAAGFYFHGTSNALRIIISIVISYACLAVVEGAFSAVRRGKFRVSRSFVLTGLLLPLLLPPGTPFWMVALGAVFGAVFGKEAFGGTGHNFFNPALVGKCFLFLSWPAAMGSALNATAAAGDQSGVVGMLLRSSPGGVGEVCPAAILLGVVVLIAFGIADWRTVVATLVAAGAMSWALWLADGAKFASPLSVLLSGGFLFIVCFVATDRMASARTRAGKLACGVLVGVLAVLMKTFSAYPTYTESAMFAVLLGSLFAPAIDAAVVAILGARRSKTLQSRAASR